LPASSQLNRVLQRRVTGTLTVRHERIVEEWQVTRRHVHAWRDRSGSNREFTCLAVGTGCHPIAPLALVASGASAVRTVDRTSLLDVDTTGETLLRVARGIETGALASDVAGIVPRFREASRITTSASDMLREVGVEVLVGDLRSLALPAGSVDLSITNSALEHIPEPQLRSLLDAALAAVQQRAPVPEPVPRFGLPPHPRRVRVLRRGGIDRVRHRA
jgi:hypothetical protein